MNYTEISLYGLVPSARTKDMRFKARFNRHSSVRANVNDIAGNGFERISADEHERIP